LAIVSEPSDASALSPSLSSREKAHERHPETIENVVLECIEGVEGPSESATDIAVAAQTWCAKRGAKVPSQMLIGIALAGLGFKKWVSLNAMNRRAGLNEISTWSHLGRTQISGTLIKYFQ